MRKIAFACFVIITSLLACQNKQKQSQSILKHSPAEKSTYKIDNKKVDSLSYQYINESANEPDCNANCNFESITYPVFKNQSTINDSISNRVLAFIGEKPNQTRRLHALVKSWVDESLSYRATAEQDPKFTVAAGSDFQIEILKQTPLFVEFAQNEEEDGGAYPHHRIGYFYWDIKFQKEVTFDNLFIQGNSKHLVSILEQYFRKVNRLSPSAPLDSFNFAGGDFSIYPNLRLLPNGVQFWGDDGNSHAWGSSNIEITVPYAVLKKIIKPNSIIKQYYQ